MMFLCLRRRGLAGVDDETVENVSSIERGLLLVAVWQPPKGCDDEKVERVSLCVDIETGVCAKQRSFVELVEVSVESAVGES